MTKYDGLLTNRRNTPQTEQADSRQVLNSAGGFTFTLDPWKQLDRFLILGSDAGTYYVDAKKLTRDNAKVVDACLALDAAKACAAIVAVSKAGRAPSNDAAILAVALALAHPSVKTAQAIELVREVVRTGTHLFTLCTLTKGLRGWGRKMRRAVAAWYESKDTKALTYQALKYQQRGGYSHRDVLRLAHPHFGGDDKRAVADWICRRPNEHRPALIDIVESLKTADVATVSKRIGDTPGLAWEMLPSESLASPRVWEALLAHGLPMTALLRNLARMTANGTLRPLAESTRTAVASLTNTEALVKARVHPVAILKALRQYAKGHGDKGSLTWVPVPDVVDALERAFELSFGSIVPSGKRTLLALDVSGSMSSMSSCAGGSLTCAEGAAAMAMVSLRTEPHAYVMGFADQFRDLGVGRTDSLREVLAKTHRANFGRTDCSLPMLWAQANAIPVDTFAVYTDNETYAGTPHPHQALRHYRNATGIDAKLVVVGMAATPFTIADPSDAGMLDCVGFDTATPQAIAAFAGQ